MPVDHSEDRLAGTISLSSNSNSNLDPTYAGPYPAPVSKNAQKKAAKAARFAVIKLERRAREREARKERKRARREAGSDEDVEDEGESSKKGKRRKGASAGTGAGFGARVVIDLGFDEMMTDKEIVSLTSQLAYTYAAHRRSTRAFTFAEAGLVFTSLGGRTHSRMEGLNDAGYRRWTGTAWWTEGLERLWSKGESSEDEEAKRRVVYLTADADNELDELVEGDTYIIGGICDHNRYKNLCLNKAQSLGIRSARLPIGRYLARLPTRKVLTVNQVFEILVGWCETGNWEEALYAVVPKRKFQEGKKRGGSGGGNGEREEEGGEECEGTEVSTVVVSTGRSTEDVKEDETGTIRGG